MNIQKFLKKAEEAGLIPPQAPGYNTQDMNIQSSRPPSPFQDQQTNGQSPFQNQQVTQNLPRPVRLPKEQLRAQLEQYWEQLYRGGNNQNSGVPPQ